MLIMNESKAVDNIFNREYDEMTPAQMVSVLCKYYLQKEGLSPLEIKSKVTSFIKDDLCRVDYDKWGTFIDKSIKIAETSKWKEVEYVSITNKEKELIKKYPKKLQKILFTIIVLGKFYYLTKGSTWVNDNTHTIFDLAHVSYLSSSERDYLLHFFFKDGLISLPKRIDSTAFKVDCCDLEGECVFKVTSLKDLGLWWFICNGNKKYRVCKKCGAVYEKTGARDLFCQKCRGYQNSKKVVTCIDCGKNFTVEGVRAGRSKRCPVCQKCHDVEMHRIGMQKYRAKNKTLM